MLHAIQDVYQFFFQPEYAAKKMHNLFLNDKQEPDITKLKQVLDICPPMDELMELAKDGDFELKQNMEKIHPLLHGLLSWIITSNRAHLRQLSQKEHIKGIDTEYQFALCSSTPDREAQFQDLKERNGSFLAFHGSPMGNWHSILRMGLKNYSNSKYQLNGAAYGQGIYLASHFSTSWGYCRFGELAGWPKSMYGATVTCMALCEVCYDDQDAKPKNKSFQLKEKAEKDEQDKTTNKTTTTSSNPNDIWSQTVDKSNRWVKTHGIYVVGKEECVMTRFFLLFNKASSISNVDANSIVMPEVVKSFE